WLSANSCRSAFGHSLAELGRPKLGREADAPARRLERPLSHSASPKAAVPDRPELQTVKRCPR
ncbi:hypothetical protein, partial [Altericroceibacterium endophyticum]|uniref:hypothetical protein n=1 Tax=Altericroceibacterium endophyticum TaxID=1808508 RepID=UPI001F48ECBB